jgi:hypothetical protein
MDDKQFVDDLRKRDLLRQTRTIVSSINATLTLELANVVWR